MPKIIKDPIERYNESFTPRTKPEEEPPNVPKRFSGIEDNKLGDYMAKFNAWRDYTDDLLIRAAAEYTILQERYDVLRAKKYVEYNVGKVTATTIKNKLDADTELIPLKTEVVNAKVFMEMVSSKMESFTNIINVLSREITRRGQLNRI
jgi:hypothetical protein